MKLIKIVGSKPESATSTKTKRWGIFECPVCKNHVEKPLSHGKRNKSCGDKACRKAVFINAKADTSKYRKEEIISTLPHYNSILNFYNRLKNNTELKLSEDIDTLRKFVFELYAKYASMRELNPHASMYAITTDKSNILTSKNCKFVASSELHLDEELSKEELKHSCYNLAKYADISHANAIRILKQVTDEFIYINVVNKYGKKLKVLIVDKNSYDKAHVIATHNKQVSKPQDYVYLIKSNEYTKIGIAANVEKRLNNIKTSNPFEVSLISKWEYGSKAYDVEQYLHKKYMTKNVSLEWFNLSQEDIDEIKNSLDTKNILIEIEKYEECKKSEELNKIMTKNTELVQSRIKTYELAKEKARKANEKPQIETVHDDIEEWDRSSLIEANTTHGMSNSEVYKAWQTMKKIHKYVDEWKVFENVMPYIEEEITRLAELATNQRETPRIYPADAGKPVGPDNYVIKRVCDNKVKSAVARKVTQLNLDGERIATYETVTEAAKAVGGIASKISAVCKGSRKTHAGHKWKYEE